VVEAIINGWGELDLEQSGKQSITVI